MAFDLLYDVLIFVCVEEDARTFSTRSASSASTVNEGVDVGGRRGLDDKVDLGQVQPTSSYISGDQNSEFVLAEGLHGAFTLLLLHISMQALGIKLDIVVDTKIMAVLLRVGEDECLAMLPGVDSDQIP